MRWLQVQLIGRESLRDPVGVGSLFAPPPELNIGLLSAGIATPRTEVAGFTLAYRGRLTTSNSRFPGHPDKSIAPPSLPPIADSYGLRAASHWICRRQISRVQHSRIPSGERWNLGQACFQTRQQDEHGNKATKRLGEVHSVEADPYCAAHFRHHNDCRPRDLPCVSVEDSVSFDGQRAVMLGTSKTQRHGFCVSNWSLLPTPKPHFLRCGLARRTGNAEEFAAVLSLAEQRGASGSDIQRERTLFAAAADKIRLAEPHLPRLLQEEEP